MTKKEEQFFEKIAVLISQKEQGNSISQKQVLNWVIAILAFISAFLIVPAVLKMATNSEENTKAIVQLDNKIDNQSQDIRELKSDIENLKQNDYNYQDHAKNMVPFDMRITTNTQSIDEIEKMQVERDKEIVEMWKEIEDSKRSILMLNEKIENAIKNKSNAK